jgi:hypothetical protein
VEITLKEIHRGPCRAVVTLRLGDDSQVEIFLESLIHSNPHAAKSLQTSMATITALETYHNERKFKNLGDGIYEIKVPGIRLYCFKDEIEGLPAKLILATNGGTKNNKKEQNSDIKRAVALRNRYLSAKAQNPEIHYISQDHEN